MGAAPAGAASGQRGAVLITALIFLVILTLLGTSGVMNNALQERMAANARSRDLAFEAAEHALDTAHAWLMTQNKASMRAYVDAAGIDLVANDGIRTGGEAHANDATYWQGIDWDGSDLRHAPGDGLGQVSAQPGYVAERLPPPATDCDPVKAGNQSCDIYRITARGVGATAETAAILQTLYQFQ